MCCLVAWSNGFLFIERRFPVAGANLLKIPSRDTGCWTHRQIERLLSL